MISPLMQMINAEPITATEVRELFVRHVLTSPPDDSRKILTGLLRDLLIGFNMSEKKKFTMVGQEEMLKLFRENVTSGFDSSGGKGIPTTTWPAVMDINLTYPTDVIIELGAAIGYKQAAGLMRR